VLIMTEERRSALMAQVVRKEHLARLCEQGKISPEEYLQSVNTIREAEGLPPLSRNDASIPQRVARRRRSKRTTR
jgi:hypothetical protein